MVEDEVVVVGGSRVSEVEEDVVLEVVDVVGMVVVVGVVVVRGVEDVVGGIVVDSDEEVVEGREEGSVVGEEEEDMGWEDVDGKTVEEGISEGESDGSELKARCERAGCSRRKGSLGDWWV
jgi:hypothetical protein